MNKKILRKIAILTALFLFIELIVFPSVISDNKYIEDFKLDKKLSNCDVLYDQYSSDIFSDSNIICLNLENNLPDLFPIEMKIWWGKTNVTGVFVDYGIINIGETFYSINKIESNLTFYADDNTTAFGYIIQSPLLYPDTWYNGEILGGNFFFDLKEKPEKVTVKIDFNDTIPESNESNNNLIVRVLPGITISGTIYKKIDGELIPYKNYFDLSRFDDESLSDFGFRSYISDEDGNFNMSLYPYEPLNESFSYKIMATEIDGNLKLIKESDPICAGENATLNIILDGNQPKKPYKPIGRVLGLTNRTYTFFTLTSDPDRNMLYYKFKWGDRTYSDWLGPYKSRGIIIAQHVWTISDKYFFEVISKDTNGMISEWSEPAFISLFTFSKIF